MAIDGHKVRAGSLPALSLPIQINIMVNSTTLYFLFVCLFLYVCACVCWLLWLLCLFVSVLEKKLT